MSIPISTPRFLDKANTDYLKLQIESGVAHRSKTALQNLCKLYRRGYRIRPEQLNGVEQSIVGLLFTQAKEEKVRRWALNTLARLGREQFSMEAIKHVLTKHGDEPQTIAAGVAAIYRMSKSAVVVLKSLDFDDQMTTLAALQHVPANKLDLSSLPLNVENASPDLLKLALIVVGLDRAPVNLLNPRHSNAEMVKALGTHDDPIVIQYSVWAVTENSSLGLSDLGIDLLSIEQQPPNVRAWLFQLIAMSAGTALVHFDILQLGMVDPDPEARIGLARGLRDTFFDGLEAIVLDWFTSEPDPEVRQNLLDHLICQAHHCPAYKELAIDIFERTSPGSAERQRMAAVAAGTSMFGEFQRIIYNGTADLFDRSMVVTNTTNNTFNFNGGVQGGAVSLGGTAENLGTTSFHYNSQTIETIHNELSKAERELQAAPIDEAVKKEALAHVADAKADPSRDKLSRVISTLGKVEELAKKVPGAGTAITGAITYLSGLL